MTASLSLSQARRIALAAQGLDKVRPTGPVSSRAVGRTFARLQVVQIDSVNVLSRSHFLPFFSRLGNYDREILRAMAGRSPRRMMEYWAHEASFIRPEHFPDLLLWQKRKWVGASHLEPGVREGMARRILEALAGGRPMTAAQLTAHLGHEEERQHDNWGWNWNLVKRVLEHLFEEGLVTAASRTEQFERRYTLTARIFANNGPGDGTHDSGADRAASMDRLLDAAAQAHGIGTVRCFADYFRTPVKASSESVIRLVAAGRLEPVTVRGWNRPLYRHVEAKLSRTAQGRALLSPFDSLVFERRRLEELFGFHYRIEIYTPAEKRKYGYYVLPFLLRDSVVARVDLKADREAKRLLVRAAHGEPDAPPDTAVELSAELRLMAEWLGLDDVVVAPNGNLSSALASATAGN
ncbi:MULTISPECIES: winged helix-turn-helix domain-containing protein [Arthrobacter]|uniref:Winged helix-turn-helix domain-containing protein n=1 Tax=Arthrobacter terricola TaxID=2547396 RepID=A0A4R5KG03_9MICC|nr:MULTISPECIES: crosslink repair DNA glycosylase YcaQ family protein [Arthrobacter]MBT8162514.1 winged helix DNA-binding domain-containing protein [Arthrobacter sp. GN70]TDF93140.1 winged helix-turn-helix domain-containing protein [Arthrobacter terricola]